MNAAEVLTLAGYKIFPCGKNKQPMTANGFHDATNDDKKINKWILTRPPLWGIPCEPNGFFAVDIDPDGLGYWQDLLDQNPPFDYGPCQRTPRGGWHYLFNLPGFEVPNNAGKVAPGFDVRSRGYICTGAGYTWLPEHDITTQILDAPPWLLDLIKPKPKPADDMNTRKRIAITQDPDGAGEYWLQKALDQARPGNRNDTGFNLALQLRDSGLSQGQAIDFMKQYAARVPMGTGDPYTENEAINSMNIVYGGPAREPAKIPGRKRETMSNFETIQNVTVLDMQAPPPEPGNNKDKPGHNKPTDDELADAWLKIHRKTTAYGLGEWRRYTGGVWQAIPEELIKHEIGDILINAKIYGIRPTKNAISSVLEFVRLAVYVGDDLWDADIELLPCKNGTLHIPTMALRDHRPEDYITFSLPFDFDPAADAPTWQYALNTTVPEAAEFLQEFAGYALTVDTKHEIAIWLYGPSGSGKSTILEGFQAMLGNRSTLLGLAEIERSRFALGDLKGKTLAVAAEQPAIYMQASHILNSIISGERVTTERKFKDPITFYPRVKIAWAMNELPRLSETGSGLFRRVRVIKFPTLPEAERDERIKEDIKKEGSGILNWALEGLRRLQQRGKFEIPECVKQATKDFQKNNDVPAVFLEDRCLIGAEYTTQAQILYNEYRDWCVNNGHKPQSSTSIKNEWERLGLDRYRAAGKTFYRNVNIKGLNE